jgi:hypothetical protein
MDLSNNKYHFFGFNNTTVKEILKRNALQDFIIYKQEEIENIVRNAAVNKIQIDEKKNNIILYSWGKLYNKKINNQTFEEKLQSYFFNFLIPVCLIEYLNSTNCKFNFIYLSSESAKKGSFDSNYACQKAATELYIKECQLTNKESIIVGIAPSMIKDAGMTTRRLDVENVIAAEKSHPKSRLLNTSELVILIEYLMFQNTYISNTIIEINGGKFSRMKST